MRHTEDIYLVNKLLKVRYRYRRPKVIGKLTSVRRDEINFPDGGLLLARTGAFAGSITRGMHFHTAPVCFRNHTDSMLFTFTLQIRAVYSWTARERAV